MKAFIISIILLTLPVVHAFSQAISVIQDAGGVKAVSGEQYNMYTVQNSFGPNATSYSDTVTNPYSGSLGNSSATAQLDFSIQSNVLSVQGSGNATATNYIYPNNQENATAQSTFTLNFRAPQNAVVSVYYNTSTTDTALYSYSALEDVDTHQVVLNEPFGSSGVVYEVPLAAGHDYGFVIFGGAGAIEDGSLSGSANYSFDEELIISTVPEPSTYAFAGATVVAGILYYRCRKARRA